MISPQAMYPKIELHVHLEGTVRPETLLEIARRNDVALPAETPGELERLFRFTDLTHFIDVWFLVTAALQTADDFRRITADYAEEAARHGAVYIEGIFAPTVPARNGIELDELFEISDRLIVIAQGRMSPSVPTRQATVEQIGEWMSGLWDPATPTPEPTHVQA